MISVILKNLHNRQLSERLLLKIASNVEIGQCIIKFDSFIHLNFYFVVWCFDTGNLLTLFTSRGYLYRNTHLKFAFIKRCFENFVKLQRNVIFWGAKVQAWNCNMIRSVYIQPSLRYQSPSPYLYTLFFNPTLMRFLFKCSELYSQLFLLILNTF